MGELPSDIRSILEALARHEITVDEAEQLILALKETQRTNSDDGKEKGRTKKRGKTVVGKDIVVEEGEELIGSLEIVNGTAIIKGKVYGDVQLVFSELYFSGEVHGNVDLVGSKAKWDGGLINGNLLIVGSEYSGKKPVVRGRVNEVNNFFIGGVLGTVKLFVKPILSGIKLEE